MAVARRALDHANLASIQIIFNIFRQKPAEALFVETAARDVAVIARVPLASGLLTGKLRRDTRFAADDHRNYNRQGEAFDVGETFSGMTYEVGLEAVEELRSLVPDGASMAQFALRWILMQEAVSTTTPGSSSTRVRRALLFPAGDGIQRSDEGVVRGRRGSANQWWLLGGT